MQQQISLCGVYFESLFDYMEQRSSKERRGLLASSMGLLVKGRDRSLEGCINWINYLLFKKNVF